MTPDRPPNCAPCADATERDRQAHITKVDAMFSELLATVDEAEQAAERIAAEARTQ